MTDAKSMIIFEMSPESILTTVMPAYGILSTIEGIGGFAIVIIFIAKFLVNGIEDRKVTEKEIELIQKLILDRENF